MWRFSLGELKTTKHWYEDKEGKWSYVVKLNIQLSYWGVSKCVMYINQEKGAHTLFKYLDLAKEPKTETI